jgi:hypothetical protein
MKTIELKIYSFNELSEESKRKALDNYQPCTDYIWHEAYESVKAFNELFYIDEGFKSWLEYRTNFNDNVMELKGLRLRKWIINHFGYGLWKGKFYNSIGDNRVINHPCIKTNYYDMSKGAIVSSSNFYYSRIQLHNSYVLTGVYYDNVLLNPIYNFIAYKDPKNMQYVTLEDLLDDCYQGLRKSIESEIDYLNSDEAKIESIECNEYEYTEGGERW